MRQELPGRRCWRSWRRKPVDPLVRTVSHSRSKVQRHAHAARKGIESTTLFIPSLTITIRLGSLYMLLSLSS
jgi:hypothetical protein